MSFLFRVIICLTNNFFSRKRFDNFKNLCYNKYVRLRDNSNSTMKGIQVGQRSVVRRDYANS